MPQKHREAGFTFLELIIVVAMGLVVAGFAIPTYQRTMLNYRLQGDTRAINGEIQLAKMRAAANFTRARLRFFTGGSYQTEVWCKAQFSPRACGLVADANTWKLLPTSGTKRLSSEIRYGVNTQTLPPPQTQGGTLAQPAFCRQGTAGLPGGGAILLNSRCIIFNSRGFPVNSAGNPYGDYGIYITDGTAVQGTTVSRTGLTASWRHDAQDTAAASWFRH